LEVLKINLDKKYLLLGCLLFFMLFSSTIVTLAKEIDADSITSNTTYGVTSFLPSLSYVEHDAIEISSDLEFDIAHGVSSGTGTILDPYVIENLNVTTSSGTAIHIHDTTAFFAIRGCLFNAGKSDYGIFIENIADGSALIENNSCINNELGIYLDNVNFNLVINNSCTYNDKYGIQLDYSSDNTLTNNTCAINTNGGIYLYYSSDNECKNNVITDTGAGLYIVFSDSNYLSNNTCISNVKGMSFAYSNYNTVVFNKLIESHGHGLYFFTGSDNNLIHINFFIDNSNTPQAYDGGISNQWYNADTNQGNYWSDYSGSGDYLIEGSANAIDPYPLNSNVIPEYDPSLYSLLLVISSLGFLIRKRR
jgi:parallel beta-helix repeat protein